MAADFETRAYWHARFATETAFEWLVSSATFLAVLEPFLARLPDDARILHVGCGTSDLHNGLRARGFRRVVNTDYEPRATATARRREAEAFGDVQMRYAVADVTGGMAGDAAGDLGDEPFDLVVDKSTADAVACGGDEAVEAMARTVAQRLAPGGVWLSLTFSATRFAGLDLPLHVAEVARLPTPKAKPGEPDVFHHCFVLRAR